MSAYHGLNAAGIPARAAAATAGVSCATATRTRSTPTPLQSETRALVNRLNDAERARILETVNCLEFVDLAPLQIYARLLDEGVYLGSVSTFYRILAHDGQVNERRRQARQPARTKPELVATGPGQVYSSDITKLAGPVKGNYYDAYAMIDIYSRYVVGAHVHAHESAGLAEEMMKEVFGIQGIPKVVHADRGTSMTSKTVATLLADLEVTRSHSRPRVLNDNPYSEAWFKTLKYAPVFPERFGSIGDAREFVDRFVDWHNHDHHLSGVGLHSAADVHYGLAAGKARERSATLAAARAEHPERFDQSTDPKILDLQEAAWINPRAVEDDEVKAAA